MPDVIRIKPHHFVDLISHAGEPGASFAPHPYGHAVHEVAEKILADPHVLLCMELGADDICAPCVHNRDGRCDDTIDTSWRPDAPRSKREWNLRIDRRWCDVLGLAQGDRLTALALCRRLRERAVNLRAVYPELPPDRIARRERRLAQGVAWFLGRHGAQGA